MLARGKLVRIHKDASRTAPLGLFYYRGGLLAYCLLPANLGFGEDLPRNSGQSQQLVLQQLGALKLGTHVYNVGGQP